MRAACGAWRSSSARTGDSGNGLSTPALNALTVFYAQALAADGIKVNALAPGLRATGLNLRAASAGGDPAEAAAAAVPLALLPEDGPTGYSWDGTDAPSDRGLPEHSRRLGGQELGCTRDHGLARPDWRTVLLGCR
jgi:NAD(P)-dependent dehydrogenase (short-subunit alcohol dehydrogenase family)